MSTTTDLRVAVQYSLGATNTALLFKLHTKSFMDRGADLSFLSAFPLEREYLYPPLTFLHPTGKTQELRVGAMSFTVVEVEPHFGA